MSRVYICDFCGSKNGHELTTLGERWEELMKGLYGRDACKKCWDKLSEAFYSHKEVKAIRKKNVQEVLDELGVKP